MNLKISFFASARDNQPKPMTTTWDELAGSLADARVAECTPETCKRSECTSKHGHAWSPASYPENATRARGAVEEVCALVLDIDHVPTDEEVAMILDKIPYKKIVHASHSDRPGDRCLRVIVSLTSPVAGYHWPNFWTNVIAHLDVPVDQATKDASRLYFLPSRPQGATTTEFGDGTDYLYATADGPSLDPSAFITETINPSPVIDVGPTPTIDVTSTGRQGAIDALAQAWPATGRHQASLALSGALAHASWPENDIVDFMADLMAKVYPEGDPNPRKREEQARDSYLKVTRGEPVSGWPSLIPHVGEQTVAFVTTQLNIGQKPQWLQALINKHSAQAKPTHDTIKAHYKARRSQLLRQRTNPQSQLEAKIFARILDHEQLAEGDDDRTQALVLAIRTLIKYAPESVDHMQLAQLLVHVFPVNVGQDANKPWSDVLTELFDQCAEALAEEAAEGGEFDMETSGVRLGKPKNTLKNLYVALKKLDVSLRFDEFAFKKLMKRGDQEEAVIEDIHLKDLWLDLEMKYELTPTLEKLAACLEVEAYHHAFHPVRDYLDDLEWDGVPRISKWLHTYGQAPDNEYTRAVGRLVLVAAVRRARRPGCKFDEMLILEGEQGTMKSSALIALCPLEDWYTNALPLGSDSKKVIEVTGGKWIVEAGELGGMNNKDIRDLKDFLSSLKDEARMSYGREVRIARRQFIIIGTTNDAKYLRDPTGNRRFWPVTIIQFDLEALLRDRDQLWAEAAHYEAQGESIRLDPCYYALAAQEQEERRVVDTIEVILEEAFHGLTGKMKAPDVYQLLGKDAADVRQDEQRRVGEAMRRLGWNYVRRRLNGKPTWVWAKGTKEEENALLGVTGRKVVKVQEGTNAGAPALPGLLTKKTN